MAIRERRKRIYRKRIPYGMQNFEDIRERDCYYVDKTSFIEDIEDSNMYFFYIRPRRFGKSLTLSMLEHYYDINKKDKFESLFGGLYIGENPTPEHNTYLIIHLNFAEVDAGIDNYQSGLDVHCNIMFNSFCNQYAHLLPPDAKEGLNREIGAIGQLRYLCQVCKEANQKSISLSTSTTTLQTQSLPTRSIWSDTATRLMERVIYVASSTPSRVQPARLWDVSSSRV